jgi:multiple antibiotic resistance protein
MDPDLIDSFLLSFVPLFVAVDALGALPLFLALTRNMDPADARRTAWRSIVTAALIALAFAAGGPAVLELIGITVEDFMIAGGLLLVALAVRELLGEKEPPRGADAAGIGVVPLGVPLVAGPAVFTTSLLLVDQFGLLVVSAAILANMLIAALAFRFAGGVRRAIGVSGASIASKIAILLLAAIGVMMIRRGFEDLLAAAEGVGI